MYYGTLEAGKPQLKDSASLKSDDITALLRSTLNDEKDIVTATGIELIATNTQLFSQIDQIQISRD